MPQIGAPLDSLKTFTRPLCQEIGTRMTRIFDNIDVDLGPHLLETFATADRMDSAVGYFNLRGWATFADAVESKPVGDQPVMRVLVGMTLADPDEQVLTALQNE